jgi:hypothetical protein
MPSSFDDGWSSGPFWPFPLEISQIDLVSERVYVLGSNVFGGGDVFHIPGCIVQYANSASPASPPRFRRTLGARVGSRGVMRCP